jgi:hypothetical protein
MNESKIEPRLRSEMRRLEEAGRASEPISILLQIATGADDASTYAVLEERLRASVAVIQEHLKQSGFNGPIHENALAGSLELALTVDQITAVSRLAEVKRVILNRVDKVAIATER